MDYPSFDDAWPTVYKLTPALRKELTYRYDTCVDDPGFIEDNPDITADEIIQYCLDDIVDLGDDCGGYLATGIVPEIIVLPSPGIDHIAEQTAARERQAQELQRQAKELKEWRKLRSEAKRALKWFN
jgi:hypothetical protein